MLLAALLMFVIGQASTAFAATGAVTTWGGGYPTPQPVPLPAGVTASFVSAGEDGVYAITNDGVYFWSGVVNITATKFAFPAPVTRVRFISDRNSHALAITNDGLYSWGQNNAGQVGDGTAINRYNTPVKVVFPASVTGVTAVAAGYYHSLAITNDGLYAWGENITGQLGIGSLTNTAYPTKVQFSKKTTVTATAISAGRNHTLAIASDGLYAWGDNSGGKLGLGTMGQSNSYRWVPTKVPLERGQAFTPVS